MTTDFFLQLPRVRGGVMKKRNAGRQLNSMVDLDLDLDLDPWGAEANGGETLKLLRHKWMEKDGLKEDQVMTPIPQTN